MSSEEIEAPCFLCGHKAVYKETDYAHRRFYSCTNPECGEYEISLAAMERVDQSSEFKQQAALKAKQCRDTDEILEIVTTGPKEVTASFKLRSAGPG